MQYDQNIKVPVPAYFLAFSRSCSISICWMLQDFFLQLKLSDPVWDIVQRSVFSLSRWPLKIFFRNGKRFLRTEKLLKYHTLSQLTGLVRAVSIYSHRCCLGHISGAVGLGFSKIHPKKSARLRPWMPDSTFTMLFLWEVQALSWKPLPFTVHLAQVWEIQELLFGY